VNSASLQLSWRTTNAGTTTDHYEIKLDNGVWTNIGTQTQYTFNGLTDGNHTFNIKPVSAEGVSQTYSIIVVIAAGTEQAVPLMYVGLAVVVIAVATTVVLLVLKFVRNRPKFQ
jgi:predicted phage tail protein